MYQGHSQVLRASSFFFATNTESTVLHPKIVDFGFNDHMEHAGIVEATKKSRSICKINNDYVACSLSRFTYKCSVLHFSDS